MSDVPAPALEVEVDPATGGPRLAVEHPPGVEVPAFEAEADRLGLPARRTLLQLRRPLPVPADHPERAGAPVVDLRPFDPDRDADAWLRTNNAAFADHPDQGRQTSATLAATLAEPWVDLAGLLVVDDPARPGELAGSCWTRVHPATEADPTLGEIFVIGVHPSHHGRRLGAALVLAGLDHLARQPGVATAMLYVEADNPAARRLYERLGFEIHLVRTIASAAPWR